MENSLRRKNNNTKDRTAVLFVLYAVLTIAIYTLPMLKITLPYMAVALLLLASLFFFMVKNSRWLYWCIILCAVSLIIMAMNVMTGAYSLVDSINEMMRNIRFFLPVLWGCYAVKSCNDKQKKFVLLMFGAISVFILIKTFNALQIDPMVCRDLAAGVSKVSTVRTALRMQNVGGFEYSYMMGIVTLAFVWTAVKAKNKKLRIISFVAAVIGYYFIIQTMYTLLLILTFVGTVLILFVSTKNVAFRVFIVLFCIFAVLFIEPILEILSDIFSFSSMLNQKFTNMHLALKFDDVDLVGSRPELLKRGFENWTMNPILGGKHPVSNSHSFIMSTLENSGIVGFGLWLGFFIKSWKMLKEEMVKKKVSTSLIDVVMMYVLVLSFLNPIGYVFEILFAAFFIVPIWCSVVKIYAEDRLRRKDRRD